MHRLTFGLKLLVSFFACDAAIKLGTLAALAAEAHPAALGRSMLVDRYFPLLLAVAIDGLLAGLIVMRARSGRFWGIIFLGALATLALFRIVVDPGRWSEIPPGMRARELATVVMYAVFLAILLSRKAAKVLVR